MIPAIKESNQLKRFLGIRDNCPEFYNETLDQVKVNNEGQERHSYLKDFIKSEPKSDLMKYIKSEQKYVSNTKTNTRY